MVETIMSSESIVVRHCSLGASRNDTGGVCQTGPNRASFPALQQAFVSGTVEEAMFLCKRAFLDTSCTCCDSSSPPSAGVFRALADRNIEAWLVAVLQTPR